MAEIDWLHLPSLAALRAFEATARLNGFSAAARALNVTAAAVAQQVRGLETELGVPLVRREGRGLALTPEGDRLARDLSDGFGQIAKGVGDLRRTDRDRGIRVTATVAFSQTVLMPRLPKFWALHPGVAVSLTPTQTLLDIEREGIDLAIRNGDGNWPGLTAEFLCQTQVIVAGAPSVVARSTDLSELPWITDLNFSAEQAWIKQGGLDSAKLTIVDMDSPLLSVAAAEAGLGLLFATDIVVADSILNGRLVQVDFPQLPQSTYWMVTPTGPERAGVVAFKNWLRSEISTLS